jgi:hypothetical protein
MKGHFPVELSQSYREADTMFNARRWLFVVILMAIFAGSLIACGTPSSTTEHDLSMALLSDMPGDVQAAPAAVQQAYQFAVANPKVMQQIPCYCGCGAMGHTSNYMCYVHNVDASGKIAFDSHAIGCSICVDITQDVMRMMRQGMNVKDIRAYVDKTYSRYGPSNMK